MSSGDLIKLCPLWKRKTKDGRAYLGGHFQDAQILIFQNSFKSSEHDRDPDYLVYVAAKKEKQKESGDGQAAATRDDDGLPF